MPCSAESNYLDSLGAGLEEKSFLKKCSSDAAIPCHVYIDGKNADVPPPKHLVLSAVQNMVILDEKTKVPRPAADLNPCPGVALVPAIQQAPNCLPLELQDRWQGTGSPPPKSFNWSNHPVSALLSRRKKLKIDHTAAILCYSDDEIWTIPLLTDPRGSLFRFQKTSQ